MITLGLVFLNNNLFQPEQRDLEDRHSKNYRKVQKIIVECIALKNEAFFRRELICCQKKWNKVVAAESRYYD